MSSFIDAWQNPESLLWGIKPSFLSYLQGLEDLEVMADDGVQVSDAGNLYSFPFAARRELRDGGTRLEFSGDLRLKAHGGMLLVIFMNPWLTITDTGVELCVVDLMAWPDASRREVIGASSGEHIDLGNKELELPLWLTANGVETFNNVYQEGTALAPVRLTNTAFQASPSGPARRASANIGTAQH